MNLLPQADASERAVLGFLILEGMAGLEKCLRLKEPMFALDSHRRIWRMMLEMIESGGSPDALSLRAESDKRMWDVGGLGYLVDLTSDIGRNFDPSWHVELIVEKWKLREGMRICNRYETRFAGEDTADETLARMQADVFDAMQEMEARRNPLVMDYSVAELNRVMDYSTSPRGWSYGIPNLDEFTNGMQPGEVTVIGARSGVGKTSVMCQIAAACCSQGMGFDMFSLEMRRETILHRLWSIQSGVSYSGLRKKNLHISDQQTIKRTALEVAEWPLRIHDDGDMSLSSICALARLSARVNGMCVMGVDYAQIVNAEGKDDRIRVSNVSRTLTKLAKREGIHLVLLSQLRKVPSESYSKPPHVGDLRETGQLENDANTVILLHRGWDDEAGKISYDAELLIPKQRDGETGVLRSRFDPKTLAFR